MSPKDQEDIETILKAIDKLYPANYIMEEKDVKRFQLLASEYKRILKQRDALREAFLRQEQSNKGNMEK